MSDAAPIALRRARPDEAGLLTRLACEAKAHWGYPPAVLESWRDALAITAAMIATLPVWVAETGGAVAGVAVLDAPGQGGCGSDDGDPIERGPAGCGSTVRGPTERLLDDLFVLPACMGRGVGGALLAHACELARRDGAAALRIDADPHAEPFYRAHGAVVTHTLPAPIAGQPGRVRPQMRIDLGAG